MEDPDDEMRAMAEELRERVNDELVEELQALGVHIQSRGLAVVDMDGLMATAVLTGVLGDLAFTDRVQDPETERVREEFDELADRIVHDEFEQRRRRLLGGESGAD